VPSWPSGCRSCPHRPLQVKRDKERELRYDSDDARRHRQIQRCGRPRRFQPRWTAKLPADLEPSSGVASRARKSNSPHIPIRPMTNNKEWGLRSMQDDRPRFLWRTSVFDVLPSPRHCLEAPSTLTGSNYRTPRKNDAGSLLGTDDSSWHHRSPGRGGDPSYVARSGKPAKPCSKKICTHARPSTLHRRQAKGPQSSDLVQGTALRSIPVDP